jgi:hypothetical protein
MRTLKMYQVETASEGRDPVNYADIGDMKAATE